MSWPTVVWSMIVASCVTMALPHLVVGIRNRGARVHLILVLLAVSVAWIAAAELRIMRATTSEEIGSAMQWAHVPVALAAVAIVGFIHFYFGTGRLWIGVLACVLRVFCLGINFAIPPNLNFTQITALRQFEFLGEIVSMPVGPRNPWTAVAYLSSLLLLAYVIQASWELWKKGKPEHRRRAVLVGGGVAFFILVAQGSSVLINSGLIDLPFLVSFPFVAIVAAMSFELGYDVIRTAQLSRDLEASTAALRDNEARMILAAESARLALWEWDVERDEIWMTDRGRSLLGIEPNVRIDYAGLVGKVHPEDRAERDAAIRKAVDARGSYAMDYRLVRSDGTVRWIAARGRCLHGDDGSLPRLLGVSMDITKQKNADTEARLHREELAHLGRVAMLGEMGAALAHEINQPLAAIANNASAGRRFIGHGRGDADRLDSLFEAIVADSHRAGDIVRSIRGMILRGETERCPVDLDELVTDSLRLLRSDALARNCALSADVTATEPLVVAADSVQIKQVLVNLVLNACEAMREMPPQERRVNVSIDRPAPDRIRVSVCDTGSGFPTEALQRSFDPFVSTKAGGLGMGLAIARSIVQAHSGDLHAENIETGGACVRFWLPAVEEGGE